MLESQTDIFIFLSLKKQPTQRTGTYLSKSCVTTGFPGILKQKMEQAELEGNTEHQLRGSKGKVTLELNSNTLKATQHQQLTCQYSFCHPNLFIGQGI